MVINPRKKRSTWAEADHILHLLTKVSPDLHFQHRLYTSPNRNNQNHLVCFVGSTVAGIRLHHSNVRIPLCDVPKALKTETKYRSRHICRERESEHNFYYDFKAHQKNFKFYLDSIQLKVFPASFTSLIANEAFLHVISGRRKILDGLLLPYFKPNYGKYFTLCKLFPRNFISKSFSCGSFLSSQVSLTNQNNWRAMLQAFRGCKNVKQISIHSNSEILFKAISFTSFRVVGTFRHFPRTLQDEFRFYLSINNFLRHKQHRKSLNQSQRSRESLIVDLLNSIVVSVRFVRCLFSLKASMLRPKYFARSKVI